MATQMMGLMSTPPKGGTTFLVTTKKGSVGQAIRFQGKRLRSIWGYQVKTIRMINRSIITPSKEPRIKLAMEIVVINLRSLFLAEYGTPNEIHCYNFKICDKMKLLFSENP